MPTLNSDGSINISTDGSFNMNNDDEYYHFVCGLIAASMKMRKPAKQKTSINDLYFKGMEKGLAVCWRVKEHIANVITAEDRIVGSWTPGDQNSYYNSAPATTCDYLTDPAPHVRTNYIVEPWLINSGDAVTFKEIHLYLDCSGIPLTFYTPGCTKANTVGIERTAYSFYPYWGVEDSITTILDDTLWTQDEDNRQEIEDYLTGRNGQNMGPFVLHLQVNEELLGGLTLEHGGAVRLCAWAITLKDRVVYRNGVTPVTCPMRFYFKRFSILPAAGSGHMIQMFSYANKGEIKYPVRQHCTTDYITGYQNYEGWFDHPSNFNDYWTLVPDSMEVPDEQTQSTQKKTAYKITLKVLVDSDDEATMFIHTYFGDRQIVVAGHTDGEITVDIEAFDSALTDNTQLQVTSDVSADIAVETGTATVQITAIELDTDPTIEVPSSFSTEKTEVLTLSESVWLGLQQAPTPEAEDHIALVDDTFVKLTTPPANPDLADELIIADNALVKQTIPVSPDTNEHISLVDSTLIRQTTPVSPDTNEHIGLTDNALLHQTQPVSPDTSEQLVLADVAVIDNT